ncbi:MAG: hypothetical protein JKY22_06340 [Flavobacteriaceae bacterium]|nr:hypothetical protein [Flavobacteriaceae bacterium]
MNNWKNKTWLIISFFTGVLVCYILLQFSYFEIKKELDIPNIIISIITLIIGVWIAVTLQRKINRSQNRHSFLLVKLDILWNAFNSFSTKLAYDNHIDATSIRKMMKEVIHPIDFLKNMFETFDINDACISNLETELESLEEKLSNIPAKQNVIDLNNHRDDIENDINIINKCFSLVLKDIQDL